MSFEKSIDTPTFFPTEEKRKRKKKKKQICQPSAVSRDLLFIVVSFENNKLSEVCSSSRLVKVDTQQRKWVGVVLAAV
jgi:hypothetical protein